MLDRRSLVFCIVFIALFLKDGDLFVEETEQLRVASHIPLQLSPKINTFEFSNVPSRDVILSTYICVQGVP